ncbi:MAG: hypothetical protein CMB45_04890 [Euryarchaeota archaeon]|nr:hypothetical protein [Euryarchaeota archaeon]|tara:strand:+ start:6450 stop:6761 length:312 start_codon:yes stop_codon:yes gene_type:complete
MSQNIEKMSHAELIDHYNTVSDLESKARKAKADTKEEIMKRIANNGGALITKHYTATVTTYPRTTTAPIEDIKADLGEEFVKDNLAVLTKTSESSRLKIKQNA